MYTANTGVWVSCCIYTGVLMNVLCTAAYLYVYCWAVYTDGDDCVVLAGYQVYIVGLSLLSFIISVLCNVSGFLSPGWTVVFYVMYEAFRITVVLKYSLLVYDIF